MHADPDSSEATGLPLALLDADGRVVWTSDALVALTGCGRADCRGATLAEVLKCEPHDRDILGAALSAGLGRVEGVRVRLADGTTCDAALLLTALDGASGEATFAVAVYPDVAAGTSARRSIELASAIDASIDGIAVLDSEARFLYMNDAHARIYGFRSPSELIGQSWEVLYEDVERERVGRDILPAMVQLGRWRGEAIGRRTDGTTFPQELSLALTPAKTIVCVVRDMTRERLLAAQLHHGQKMEAIGRMAGGIAHDFNNLLTVIRGAAEALADDSRIPADLSPDLDHLTRAVDRAAALTSRLLAFSRNQPTLLQPMSLADAVRDAESLLRRVLPAGVALTTEIERELPLIEADRVQIDQILLNLVVNAKDAMPSGGELRLRAMHVTLDDALEYDRGTVPAGNHVMLEVTDTGTGMAPEVQAHVFEPFFTTKAPGRGTGLGLATVYGLVQQERGHVVVRSEPGRGTTFQVYWPVFGGATTLSARDLPGSAAARSGTETLLLVDDEAGVRQVLQRMLARAGFTVVTAPSGDDACAAYAARDGGIDLLLTDVVMPGMDGWTLGRTLRERDPGLRVIYMSGYTQNETLIRGRLAPGEAFLPKPFTQAELLEKIAQTATSDTITPSARSVPAPPRT